MVLIIAQKETSKRNLQSLSHILYEFLTCRPFEHVRIMFVLYLCIVVLVLVPAVRSIEEDVSRISRIALLVAPVKVDQHSAVGRDQHVRLPKVSMDISNPLRADAGWLGEGLQ